MGTLQPLLLAEKWYPSLPLISPPLQLSMQTQMEGKYSLPLLVPLLLKLTPTLVYLWVVNGSARRHDATSDVSLQCIFAKTT